MNFIKTRLFRIVACCLVPICPYAAYSYQRYVYPHDEVQIQIRGLPPDISFVCLVATTDIGPVALNWTHTNMLGGRATQHPDHCTMSFIDQNLSGDFIAPLQWIHAQRIGILIKTTDRQWRVSWFSKDKAELKGHSLLFGRGSVAFDFSNADENEPMSLARLEKLGMNYSLTRPNRRSAPQ